MKRALTLLLTTTFVLTAAAAEADKPAAKKEKKHHHHAKVKQPTEAVAVLVPMKGHDTRGVLVLKQKGKIVHITGKIEGLSPGKHGFHIHEFGDLRAPDGTSAGGHYNPGGHKHGGPDSKERHAGDLGNIVADKNGVANVDIKTANFKLHFVLGRAFVVHAGADDLSSQPSGAAGPRAALGVIGIANVKDSAAKKSKK